MIQYVRNDKEENLAIIMRNNHNSEGVEFITQSEYSQQLAYMKHVKGKK